MIIEKVENCMELGSVEGRVFFLSWRWPYWWVEVFRCMLTYPKLWNYFVVETSIKFRALEEEPFERARDPCCAYGVCGSSVFKVHSEYWLSVVVQSLCQIWMPAHGRQHCRLPCPSPPLGHCLNSCPLSQWCHPTILSSIVPFFCHQSFLVSGSCLMSQVFASRGESIEASVSV